MRLTIATPAAHLDDTRDLAVIGMKGPAAVAAMGLQAIPMEI
jgi:hypothetical protein